MNIQQFMSATTALIAVNLTLSNPAKAEWVAGNGLISQAQDTIISGFEITEYEPQDYQNGSLKYYYLTKSGNKNIAGEMIVRGVGQRGITGVFTDMSTDQTEGCYGRFEIKQVSGRSKFNTTWHIDGKVKNRSCPLAGKSITLENMTLGTFTRWVD